ncbi:hemerythrin domain-containing protein [Pelomonas sp. SE-A7]|uniref:hemerythrin domain-containing protein n=1 Tax=Pelomonas sp. SE-A7 TaxID=3054953 RepID=UPI00259C6F0F|nr:hemerythrin domain-containing protein [Pelomonas sp. SE-A7]MDM4764570.1 hemerythrin domain-containing protein [Pelomonas sp. SE-A7]
MSALLTWSDSLVLNQPQLDATHQEMVDLINGLAAALAAGGDAMPAFQALLDHTEAHFAMEERWMADTGFAPENCHSSQHQMVLNVLHEVKRHALELNDLEPMRIIGGELAQWLPAHAEMMDAALVFHMGEVGYDPVTGHKAKPLSEVAISSCGSAGSCSDEAR